MAITWRTIKSDSSFKFEVYTVEYKTPSKVLKSGSFDTRAKATKAAKNWTRSLRAAA